MNKLLNYIVEVSDDSLVLLDDFFGLFIFFLKLFFKSLNLSLLLKQFRSVKTNFYSVFILVYLHVCFVQLLQQGQQYFVVLLNLWR
jgi:hypothetical protein